MVIENLMQATWKPSKTINLGGAPNCILTAHDNRNLMQSALWTQAPENINLARPLHPMIYVLVIFNLDRYCYGDAIR